MIFFSFFFNDTATTEIYTLSLHDALPISEITEINVDFPALGNPTSPTSARSFNSNRRCRSSPGKPSSCSRGARSEEHTSELQSRQYLVCRLLLEKKKKKNTKDNYIHNHTI